MEPPPRSTAARPDAPRRLPLLEHYLGDVRTLLPGGAAGILQLMDPPLGAAVAAQSDFFDDPFGRVYRSIPQIWATVLAPDGGARARSIRDVHRTIEGRSDSGQRFRALDPETFWWAHATFTWEVFEAIRLFFPGGLAGVDRDALYAETVAWYERYGMSTRPVPEDLASFERRFQSICAERLEMTPAAKRTLDMALAGEWRPPLVKASFRDPITRGSGRVVVLGTLPSVVRERFGLPWRAKDRLAFDVICASIRGGMSLVPASVHRRVLERGLKFVGGATRGERFEPT